MTALSDVNGIESKPDLPTIVIEAKTLSFKRLLQELWEYRELLYFFAWRDVKARYAQTLLGVAWAILQPLVAMLIFTVVFGYWIKLSSDGIPYPLFAYTALLPWTFLVKSLERSGQCIVAESNLVKKVYFPRIVLPLAATFAGMIDFVMGLFILIGMMIWYGIVPTMNLVVLPMLMVSTIIIVLAVSLWLAALNARYRDIGGTIPLLSQLWMYASPVVYAVSVIPEQWQPLYRLNPMVGVIEGFRWSLLGTPFPNSVSIVVSVGAVLVLFVGGVLFFQRMERTFNDVL